MENSLENPVCTSVSVQTNRGGKVAIVDFGKINSGWGISMSRNYDVPTDWTDEQVDGFQLEAVNNLAKLIQPLDQAEYDVRYEAKEW